VQSYDFPLTALDYAGVDPGAHDFDSRSLRPFLADSAQPTDVQRTVFTCTGMSWPMVRYQNFKYSINMAEREPVLFDLDSDRNESVNLANDPDYAEITRDLSARLAQRMARPSLADLDAAMT
jgi:arylsulfatase A-like enzyme